MCLQCLAAGSSILNREVESTSMRPLAKALTRHLDYLRSVMRDQCLRNIAIYSDRVPILIAFVYIDSSCYLDRNATILLAGEVLQYHDHDDHDITLRCQDKKFLTIDTQQWKNM